MVESKKLVIEASPENLRRLLPGEKRELTIYGILQDWKIDPQKLKDELREEEE